MKSFIAIAVVMALSLVCLAGTAQAELVTNGDFSTGALDNWTVDVTGDGQGFKDTWGGLVDEPTLTMRVVGPSNVGTVFVHQEIDASVSAGEKFDVSFDACGWVADNDMVADLYWDDGGTLTALRPGSNEVVLNIIPDSSGIPGTHTFDWTATAGGDYIGESLSIGFFTEAALQSGAAVIVDNVSATVSEVPEPGAIVLLATGLIGLLCYAWRKRK